MSCKSLLLLSLDIGFLCMGMISVQFVSFIRGPKILPPLFCSKLLSSFNISHEVNFDIILCFVCRLMIFRFLPFHAFSTVSSSTKRKVLDKFSFLSCWSTGQSVFFHG